VKSYEEIAKSTSNNPDIYVDLGNAYENSGNVDKALENYLKSIAATNGQYATGYLRAAIIYDRKQDLAKASEFLDKAEQLYSVETNNEGVNEVRRQRGILFRDQGKYDLAREQFERSLEAARTLGNYAQQISALIELSFLLSSRGSIAESANFAEQAVKLAQEQHLENLAAGGLLELGNSFSSRGDYANAEKYYQQTIDLAQANKGRRREAQALLNLGGLYIAQLKTEPGLDMVQRALTFFQQNNYSRDVSRCLTQIARAKRRQGGYEAAIEALNQKLQIAQQGGGQVQIADCYTEIGAVLFDQEKYPESLERYDQARAIYQSVNNRIKFLYGETNRANILWRIGRADEAKKLIETVRVNAKQTEGEFAPVLAALTLISGQIALSERNFAEAGAQSSEALTLAGTKYLDTAIEATVTSATAKALSGRESEATTLCSEAVKMSTEAGENNLLSHALLAQAEVALHNGDAQTALKLAIQAQDRFVQSSQLESQWRASLIAAEAAGRLGDTARREEYLAQAKSKLLGLQQAWGDEVFKAYLSRPDIQTYQRQLS
jgi:tetratricopeptide (TPR) repeat protein